MQATEPGTYNQNLQNAKNLVGLKAQQLGRSTPTPTSHDGAASR
jgi:hypothetical protein